MAPRAFRLIRRPRRGDEPAGEAVNGTPCAWAQAQKAPVVCGRGVGNTARGARGAWLGPAVYEGA